MSKEKTYKELKAELDKILEVMQRDDIDVDEALQAYQRGMEVVTQLEEYLKKAENKVVTLKAKFDA